MLKEVPILVFGDRTSSVVDMAKKIGLGEEWVVGDPMNANVNAIVSPANTIGDMSGGYDLVIRNKLGSHVEDLAIESLRHSELPMGGARAIKTQSSIPWMIIVPTVVGSLSGGNTQVGSLQSKTPIDVIERGAYNMMMEAYRNNIPRLGSVLLGGGVGGVLKDKAIRAMFDGYMKAFDEIDELIWGS